MYLLFLQIYFPRYALGGLGAHFSAAATLKWSHLNPPFWVFFLILLCLEASGGGKAVDEKRRRQPVGALPCRFRAGPHAGNPRTPSKDTQNRGFELAIHM